MLRFQEHAELAAFEELFRKHRLGLFHYLRRITRSQDVAEEISQQTWLKVIEAARAARYNAALRCTFKTWLYTVARNHYVDSHMRAHAVTKRIPPSDVVEPTDPGEGSNVLEQRADTDRVRCLLDSAIDELPFEQREVVLLWAYGHELAAIAEISGAPCETVVSRKKYALAKLRGALAALGVLAGDT